MCIFYCSSKIVYTLVLILISVSFCYLFSVLVVCVSNLTLTVTVLDRFLATLHSPLQKYTQDRVVIVMLLVWIFGTLLSLPYILYTRFLEFDWIGGHERLCQAHFPSIESRRAYVTIFCLLGYVLPMLVMFFLISVALRRPQGVTRDNMTQEDRMRCQMKRRVSRFLFFYFLFMQSMYFEFVRNTPSKHYSFIIHW